MIKKLQKKYALSEQGAKDLIKGCLACVLQNLSFMFPVGLLYYLVSDLMNGGVPGGKIPFSRSYQYHYGGLHLPGAEFFAFYP